MLTEAMANQAKLLAVTGARTIENTFDVFNEVGRNAGNASGLAQLYQNVHPDAKIRDAARVCDSEVSQFTSALLLDREVYDALAAVDVASADANTKRFASQTLRDFKGSTPQVGSTTDAFLAVYRASDGALLRAHRFGSMGSAQIRRVVVSPDGSIYAVGEFDGTIDLAGEMRTASGENSFLVALDPGGQRRWSRVFESSNLAEARGLAIDGTSLYVSGVFDGPMTVGSLSLTPAGPRDGFLASLDLDGNPRWLVQLGGGTGCRRFDDLAIEPCDAGVAVAGGFRGDLTFNTAQFTSMGDDGFVAGFGLDGTPRWIEVQAEAGNDSTTSVAISGNTLLAGGYRGAVETVCGNLTPFGLRDLAIDIFALP